MRYFVFTFSLLVFAMISVGCSRGTFKRVIYCQPIDSHGTSIDSTGRELQIWQHRFDTATNGYYVRYESYSPPLSNHFFFILHNDTAVFKAFDEDIKTNNHTVMEASYGLDLWNDVDSLVSRFWTIPMEIPVVIGVSDGGETEMIGKKNGKIHSVFSTSPHLHDPEFDTLANILAQQLYLNTLIEHSIKNARNKR